MTEPNHNPLKVFSNDKRFIGAIYSTKERDLIILPESTSREVIGWVCTVAMIMCDGEYKAVFKKRVQLFKRLMVHHAKVKPFIKEHVKEINETIEERMQHRRKYDTKSLAYAFHDTGIEDLVEYRDGLLKALAMKKELSEKNSVSDQEIERARQYPIDQIMDFKKDLFAKCIFDHEEKTGSMKYYPATNSVYCFGCHKSGDAITVYRHLYGATFIDAVKFLSK